MKQTRFSLVLLVILTVLASCAFHKEKPLDQGFWYRKAPNIGVALAETFGPSVKIESTSATTMGFGRTRILVLGHRAQDDRTMHPQMRSEGMALHRYLKGQDARVLENVHESFVKSLADAGLKASALTGPMREIDPSDPALKGLDAVIILDYDWYGPDCHYTDLNQDFTEAEASLSGRMIDLSSRAVLWQSPIVNIRTPISCKCDKPECFPSIDAAMKKAVSDAAAELQKDLFRNRP